MTHKFVYPPCSSPYTRACATSMTCNRNTRKSVSVNHIKTINIHIQIFAPTIIEAKKSINIMCCVCGCGATQHKSFQTLQKRVAPTHRANVIKNIVNGPAKLFLVTARTLTSCTTLKILPCRHEAIRAPPKISRCRVCKAVSSR